MKQLTKTEKVWLKELISVSRIDYFTRTQKRRFKTYLTKAIILNRRAA